MEHKTLLTAKQYEIVMCMLENYENYYYTYNNMSSNLDWLTPHGFNKIMGDLDKLFVVSRNESGWKLTPNIYSLEYKQLIPHTFILKK